MLDKIKKCFHKRKSLDEVKDEVIVSLKNMQKEIESEERKRKMLWEKREWDACVSIYCSYDTVSYEKAVHQAHELVKSFKENMKDEVNESK